MISPMSSGKLRLIASLTLFALGLARAQDNEPIEADPPDRAARLSFIEGDVTMQPAGEEEWAPAILNRPLTTGDKLWTSRGARAEIYVGPAAVRLGDETGFSFLNVDDDTIQMRMTAGVIRVNVRALDDQDHIEIDTPNVALSLLRAGSYRVEVNEAGETTIVTVSDGEMEAIGPSEKVIVLARQVVTFTGTDELVIQTSSPGEPDEFDYWSRDRESRYVLAANSRSAEYVSPDVTGYEDLDENGTWSSEPEYGNVWTPTHVAADWAPYRYGRWLWVSPWGWTWIDDARWGYAPFHYGRWAHVRQRWCWVPGPRHARAVYAPAQVGWVGGSRLAWFPLGPREVYVPGRWISHRYVERVNDSNTEIVNRSAFRDAIERGVRNYHYRNRHVPGAMTSVSRATFTSGGRVGDHRIRVNDREFTGAHLTAAPQVEPGRESRLGGAIRRNVQTPPRTVADRQVIVKRDPPPSSAHFARSVAGRLATPRASPDQFTRPQIQDQPERENRGAVRTDRPALQTAPRVQPAVPDPRASRQQQERRNSEVRQRLQQQIEQANQLREQQRQRPPDVERRAPPRQAEQRERNVQAPRVEQRQPEVRQNRPAVQAPAVQQPSVQRPSVQRPSVQRPAESRSSRPQNNHSRPQRD
jgi:hypothetical protein